MRRQKFSLVIITLLLSFSVYSQPGSISGTATYQNIAATPLEQCTVRLTLVNSMWTYYDAMVQPNGSFSFSQVPPGDYTIMVIIPFPWTFVNSTDALKILQHWAGTAPLSGLYLKSADVTNDGVVTAADALACLRRVVQLIPAFSPPYLPDPGNGDWCWDTKTISISPGGTYQLDIKAVCTGDVDGI